MALTARTRELVDGLARELAAALATATGFDSPDVVVVPEATEAPYWLLSVALDSGNAGHVVLGIGGIGARAATQLIMGFAEEPADDAVVDTLREFGSQAVGTVSQDPVNVGVHFDVALERADALPPVDAILYRLSFGGSATLSVSAWGQVITAAKTEVALPAPGSTVPVLGETAAIPGAPANLDVLLDVDLPISVRFGMTEMALQALTRIGPGSVIDLARSPDDPVELLISGKVVARGEVVVVMGNYGVRITEVMSTADRIRSMGASR